EGRLGDPDLQLVVEVVALAAEVGVGSHRHVDVQVPVRPSVDTGVAGVRHAQPVAAVDALGQGDVHDRGPELAPAAAADRARLGDQLTLAAALGARAGGHDGAEERQGEGPQRADTPADGAAAHYTRNEAGPIARAV